MSYLLKALEKAQQERQQHTSQAQSEPQVVTQPATLPKSLIVIAFAVVALVAYSVFKPETHLESVMIGQAAESKAVPSNAVSSPLATSTAQSIANAQKKAESNDQLVETTPTTAASEPESVPVETVSAESISQEKIERPLDLVELDTQTLNTLPTIRFQSHIYSSAPEYRTVMINDRTLKEGMPLSANVRINEITPSGVVIIVDNQLVALPKGQDWIAPQ